MSKTFTFDIGSVEIANKPKFKEPERPINEMVEGELANLIDQLEKLLFKIVEGDETRDGRNRKDLIYEASFTYYQIMKEASYLSKDTPTKEIAIEMAGLYFSIDFGIVKNVPWFLVAPNGSLFKIIIEHIAEPDVIDFAYILKEKVIKRPPPLFG